MNDIYQNKEDKKWTLSDKLSLFLILAICTYCLLFLFILSEYDPFCLARRAKYTKTTIIKFGRGSAGIRCFYNYYFNDTLLVETYNTIYENAENVACNDNDEPENPKNCRGDTFEIVYDSLNYKNNRIIGRSPISKPKKSRRKIFEWYERNFVPKEKWCVCEQNK